MSKALSDLQKRGFSYTFRLKDDRISCNDYQLSFGEFDILEIHRFENADPGEYPVLYAIKCDKYNIKGVIVNVDGIYADVFSRICIGKILHNKEFRYEYYGKRNLSNR
jgi:hypothetical protein